MPAAFRRPEYKGPVAVVTRRTRPSAGELEPPALPPETEAEPEETPDDAELLDEQSLWGEGEPPVLERVARGLGYRTTRQITGETNVAISDYPTAELLQWVRDGGNLLFITKGVSPFFWVQGRTGAYSGSWISSFSWLRGDVHRRLRVVNPLGMAFMNVMPKGTILGLPVEDEKVQPDLLSGMVSGWVRHPAVHTVQFRYGRGKVIMTTFALEKGLLEGDPVGTAMWHDLVEHLASDACQPRITANF
jgi:hypothetical protein